MSRTRTRRERSLDDHREAAQEIKNPHRATQKLPPLSGQSRDVVESFGFATEGVLTAVRTQRNMRIHLAAFALMLITALLLRLEHRELAVLLAVSFLVLIAEMANTALEALVDLVMPHYHPKAKVAKDVGAGAVLLAALNALIVGVLLFLPHLPPQFPLPTPNGLVVTVAGFLLFLLLAIALRVRTTHPTCSVSGYVATAFFVTTTITFTTGNLLVSLMALILALLVVASQLTARRATMQEALFGTALGVLLTACVYQIPAWGGEQHSESPSVSQQSTASRLDAEKSQNAVRSVPEPSLRRNTLFGTLQ